MSRLLFALSGNLRVRLIQEKGRPYLERYYLATFWGRRYYLHRFVDSDPKGLHDHPWENAWSIVLSGSYIEERRSGPRKIRWFNRLTGDSFHRVVVDKDCWTLFSHSVDRVKPWGVIVPIAADAFVWNQYRYPPGEVTKLRWETALLGKYSKRNPLR